MVILLLAFNYGWPAVAFFWMYIVFMGVLAITIHLFEKFFFAAEFSFYAVTLHPIRSGQLAAYTNSLA